MIPITDLSSDKKTLKEIEDAIGKVIRSNTFILGDQLEAFEKKFGNFIGSSYVCGVASGTDAISLALKALGIGRGNKVLTVSFTSPFTIIGILEAGAIPVFCDINPDTLTIDLEDASRKMDSDVRAIIPVHIYGNPSDMINILAFAKKEKIKVVEDCSQANGAMIGNKYVGTFGDASTFSFYPTKNLGGFGDGGAISTNSKEVFEKIKAFRHGGQTKRFWHETAGAHSRLDEIQAAVLQVKLTRLLQENKKREAIAKKYILQLSDLEIGFQKVLPGAKSANHLFVILTKERDKLKKHLESKQIDSDIHYPYPVYRQKAFIQFIKGELKVTDDVQDKILSLPIFPNLKDKDQNRIISEIRSFFKSHK